MTILVTGSTGNIGSQVVCLLAGGNVEVRALTRSPEKVQFPRGVVPVTGSLSDVGAMRGALEGVSTLFLLSPNVPDELSQTMIALNLAARQGCAASSISRCSRAPNRPTCRTSPASTPSSA